MIHIATANPVGLYTLNPRTSDLGYMDLYDYSIIVPFELGIELGNILNGFGF
jgi:hypothetical protein